MNTEFNLRFLEQISQKDPASEHVIIWDGAGCHPDGTDERIRSLVGQDWLLHQASA